MYYGEFQRVKKVESLLEKLAYLSVGLDFFVAIATLLVMRGASYSSQMLVLGGYLMFAEVVIAGFLFFSLVAIRHYRKVLDAIALNTFINKYHSESWIWRFVTLVKRVVTLDI